MEKYVLFVNSETDYLLLPVKNFVGAKYSSATVIDLYFEKAPLSYKIPLTVNTNTGDEVAKGIAELFYNHSKSIILFSDSESSYAVNNVTAVGTFTKIVVK